MLPDDDIRLQGGESLISHLTDASGDLGRNFAGKLDQLEDFAHPESGQERPDW